MPTRSGFSTPIRSTRFRIRHWGRSVAATAELFERTTRRYGKPQFGLAKTVGRLEDRGGDREDRLVAAVLQPDPFRARPAGRPPARPQAADRRADVGPLRHAAARHGRGDAAACRGLHHRLDRRPHGAARPKAASTSTTISTTSSTCCTSSARTPMSWRSASPRCRCSPRLALMEAQRRPLRAGDHDADGRADRHAPQPDRRQPAGRGAAASTGSATTSSCRCRGRRRASRATSIRASCSSPAS